MAMFHRRHDQDVANTLTLIDGTDCQRYQGSIFALPMREAVIREKSIEFFKDPEPCVIHRNAVYMRLCSEIESFVRQFGQDTVPLDCLPQHMRDYLDL